jgi:hypothetical protein
MHVHPQYHHHQQTLYCVHHILSYRQHLHWDTGFDRAWKYPIHGNTAMALT